MRATTRHSSAPPAWAVWAAMVAARMSGAIRAAGVWFAALNVLLIVAILMQISMRHFLTGGHQIILGELQWHLYAIAMMFGLAHSQVINAHVRVDVLSRNWTPQRRAAMEIFGNLFLITPFVIIMFLQGLDYVADSWRVSESSASPVGLPGRWLIKGVIPASFALLFLALFARLLRDLVFLLAPAALSANERRRHYAAAEDAENAVDSPTGGADGGGKSA